MEYQQFLINKAQLDHSGGFEPNGLPDYLFDYQNNLVEVDTKIKDDVDVLFEMAET